MKLYCASTNRGKLREFLRAAGHFGSGVFTIELLPEMAALPVCEETGSTFRENAVLKTLHYSRGFQGWLFADDSGLEVEALDGAPGVDSAVFAGHGATDAGNNRLLLDKMRGVANRRARFVCEIALARDGVLVGTFRGEVEGELLDEPRGSQGFGYDPLFFYPPFGKTLAEIDAASKLDISHRGRALEAMLQHLSLHHGGNAATPENR